VYCSDEPCICLLRQELPEGEALRLETSPVIALFHVGGEFFMPLTIAVATVTPRCQRVIWKTTPRWSARCTPPASCLKTGKALCLPATDPLTTYAVYVEGGEVFVDIPEDA
jgi:3-phenylpropionate/trans-cinnamate dioxygenase ferredoxin subunit